MVCRDIIRADVAVAGVFRGAGDAGIFKILSDEAIGIVANAQPLIVGEVEVHLAQIHVIVQGIRVRLEERLQLRQRLLRQRIRRSSHLQDHRVGSGVPLAIVIEEKKHFVLYHGSANVAAKLIEVIRALRAERNSPIVLPGVSVESFVAIELESRSVESIAAGLGDDIDHAPARSPHLCVVTVGAHLKFLY